MSQVTFASNSTPSLVNLDANFTELYNSTNGTGQLATKVTGSGSTGGSVGVQYTYQANDKFCFVDPTRSADNREAEFLWSVGAFYGRFVNDAYGAATNWLQVNGGQAGGVTQIILSANQTFFRNSAGADIARFDTSGNFLVGTTSPSQTPANGMTVVNLTTGTQLGIGHAAGTATGTGYATYSYNAGLIGSITQSGTTAVLYNTTSDARLKKNIVDAPDAGAIIDSIKVRSFDWKEADNEHVTHGFIAQELVTVAPQAVKVGDNGAEVEDTWAVDASKLVPLLVKELQSSRREIADLKARLAAAGL